MPVFLQRRRYSERPPRYEYILTERGRDFRPVIVAMFTSFRIFS
jgi:DNA-binding HxlR family transcriptional regulator